MSDLPLSPRPLDAAVHVSRQPSLAQATGLADQGYRALISNRPDGEDPGQPTAAEMRAAAEAQGLAFHHIPVVGASLTPADVQAFREAVEAAGGPVLAFCRVGMRSAVLWALSRSGELSADELIAAAAEAGYDLRPLRAQLGG